MTTKENTEAFSNLKFSNFSSSVLEVEKTLLLAEKGNLEDKDNEVELLTAGKKFRILATMNPGGDFGKKEVKLLLKHHFFLPFDLSSLAPTNIVCKNSSRILCCVETIKNKKSRTIFQSHCKVEK